MVLRGAGVVLGSRACNPPAPPLLSWLNSMCDLTLATQTLYSSSNETKLGGLLLVSHPGLAGRAGSAGGRVSGLVPRLRRKRQSLENGMRSIWDQVREKTFKRVREGPGGVGGRGGGWAQQPTSSFTQHPPGWGTGRCCLHAVPVGRQRFLSGWSQTQRQSLLTS